MKIKNGQNVFLRPHLKELKKEWFDSEIHLSFMIVFIYLLLVLIFNSCYKQILFKIITSASKMPTFTSTQLKNTQIKVFFFT